MPKVKDQSQIKQCRNCMSFENNYCFFKSKSKVGTQTCVNITIKKKV